MDIEIIKSLKERAKEMLKDNYDRKIGDEEIYTIICELENFYTAYEKQNKIIDLMAQELIDQQVRAFKDNFDPFKYINKEQVKKYFEERCK